MPVRGIRGATSASANTREAILFSTQELLQELARVNHIREDDIASVYFTMTPDLDAAFPAAAARAMGWANTALLDAQAPPVKGDLARCIRVLIHLNTDHLMHVQHVYLRDAQSLKPERVHSQS